MGKRLSPMGYLMECLNIQSVSLSRELHVDASLISKWKSGSRRLTESSMYFDQVVDFLMEESEKSDHTILRKSLSEIYPMDNLEEVPSLEPYVRLLLSKKELNQQSGENRIDDPYGGTIKVRSYETNIGRRAAMETLLSYAEEMPVAGRIIFIDSDEYTWLLENDIFAKQFNRRILKLLDRGFTAKFVIHFSSYRDRFVKFFETFNLLLFHRNVKWYYYEYYDENVFQFSQFLVDKAVSLLGIASSGKSSATLVFTDTTSIIRHWSMAESVIGKCKKMFVNFSPDQCKDVVEYIRIIRKRGTMYAYLPAPAFVSTKADLLEEILRCNHIEEEQIKRCMLVNQRMRHMIASQFHGLENVPEQVVEILQLEEMRRRLIRSPFVSCSLSLLGGKPVMVTRKQYARGLRDLVSTLKEHDNFHVVLLSESDYVALPSVPNMNCWCRQNTWLVQMDHNGFRISDESSIVNAASVTFERCVRRVPPKRKEKESVIATLLEYALDLEKER